MMMMMITTIHEQFQVYQKTYSTFQIAGRPVRLEQFNVTVSGLREKL